MIYNGIRNGTCNGFILQSKGRGMQHETRQNIEIIRNSGGTIADVMLMDNIIKTIKSNTAPLQSETTTQINRIVADGGVIIDRVFLNNSIYALKQLGIYGNAKLLTDANFGVKKDGSGTVSKLYDISGNNNDAMQATGASQPIWGLVGGKGVITYDGVNNWLSIADSDSWYFANNNFTIMSKVVITSLTADATILSQCTPTGGAYFEVFRLVTNKLDIDAYTGIGAKGLFTAPWNTISGTNYAVSIKREGTSCFMTINGVSVAVTQSYAWGNIANISSVLGIGKSGYTPSPRYMNGQINSSIIFNIALTQPQITTLTNLGL